MRRKVKNYEDLTEEEKKSCLKVGDGAYIDLKYFREKVRNRDFEMQSIMIRCLRGPEKACSLIDAMRGLEPNQQWMEELITYVALEIFTNISTGLEVEMAETYGKILVEMQNVLQDEWGHIKVAEDQKREKKNER